MKRIHLAAAGLALALVLLATYANHFHNSFHFDGWHAVIQNQAIRSLDNIPRFFTDATTVSVEPLNQAYRPIQTLSLAIDYHIAGGLDPFVYQVSDYCWFMVLLLALFAMYSRLTSPEIALFATALFAFHPVTAESVNYITQRSEIYSTLGVVLGLVAFIYAPRARKWHLYLLPVLIGSLAKPLALMFPPLLFLYLVLFEDVEWRPALAKCIPSLVAMAAMGIFQTIMTPKTVNAGGPGLFRYWMTQPIVILHYVKSFFLPTELSMDSDREPVRSLFSEPAVIGIAFLALFCFAIWRAYNKKDMRPVVFGMLWFLVTLAPTSIPQLGEVENDHRMFFPNVGLTLAVVWAVSRYLKPRVFLALGAVVLIACAIGTRERNKVWLSEETLWKDVTEKSPRNARGLVNYGITLAQHNDYLGALGYFKRAECIRPNYDQLKLNLAYVYGMIGETVKAEEYYRQTLKIAPSSAPGYYRFGLWLMQMHRIPEAVELWRQALQLNPGYIYPRYRLMQVYREQGDATNVREMAQETLRLFPTDKVAAAYLAGTVPEATDPNEP